MPPLRHTDPTGRVHEPLVVLLSALPAPAAATPGLSGGDTPHIDPAPPGWDSWRWPLAATAHPHVLERVFMAKALMGHLSTDLRGSASLLADNRRLRTRVADLEALVLRLQADNDRLATEVQAASTDLGAELDQMQLA